MSAPFFVAGITGHVGGAAARRLLTAGHAVRTLARNPAKAADWADKGIEVREGDLSDRDALSQALAGAAGAFLLMPPLPSYTPEFEEAKALLPIYREALTADPPAKLVLLSSIGSEKASGLGNITTTHLMEEALGDLPIPTAFVRAGSFLENYLFALGLPPGAPFPSFLQPTDRPVPMVAAEDIGGVVARLLTEDWTGKRVVELGSPVSPDELASAIGAALGRPMQAQAIPREAWPAALQGMGVPEGRTETFEEMQDGFNSGWIRFGVPGTEPVAATITPEEFFQRAAGV